jgi:very-short-patch-repair endonuclease
MNQETYRWSHEKLADSLKENARRMRKEPTEAEEKLWQVIRNRKLAGFKFRRQHPFEGFIIDFYCEETKLGLEVDGKIHLQVEQLQYDQEREAYLNEFGIEIMRFTNDEVESNVFTVARMIKERLLERRKNLPSPLPLSRGRGVVSSKE